MYICITDSFFCTAEINTHCKSTLLQLKKRDRKDFKSAKLAFPGIQVAVFKE